MKHKIFTFIQRTCVQNTINDKGERENLYNREGNLEETHLNKCLCLISPVMAQTEFAYNLMG